MAEACATEIETIASENVIYFHWNFERRFVYFSCNLSKIDGDVGNVMEEIIVFIMVYYVMCFIFRNNCLQYLNIVHNLCAKKFRSQFDILSV